MNNNMGHLRGALTLLWSLFWSLLGRLVTGIQTAGKVAMAVMAIATFVVVALHFLHVEVNPAIPDVWPIFEPSGLPSVSDVWEQIRA